MPEDSRIQSVPDALLSRVRSEFLEMPGLRLTEAQGRRLWGLEPAQCSALLAELLNTKFLYRTRDGAFMRFDHHDAASVKAELPRRRTARTPAA